MTCKLLPIRWLKCSQVSTCAFSLSLKHRSTKIPSKWGRSREADEKYRWSSCSGEIRWRRPSMAWYIVLVCFKLPRSFIPSSTVKIWRSTGNTGLENTKTWEFELCFASVKIFACGRKGRVKGWSVRSEGLKMKMCLDIRRSEKRLSGVDAMVDSWRRVSGKTELGI